MKKRYLILIFIAVFVMISSIVLIFGSSGDSQITAEGNRKEDSHDGTNVEEMSEQFVNAYLMYTEDISRFLDAFMDLTYNCNYQERHYYDGADAYMTEECYGYYVPLQDPEELETTGEAFEPYASYLQGAEYYYASLTEDSAECLARVSYSASGSYSGTQRSYILLSLVRTDGRWQINHIETLND